MNKKKILVNTVPHSGTHFLTSLLENLGYEHAIYRNKLYFGTPYYRRGQKAAINWRTANLLGEKFRLFEHKNIPVSVSAPVKITKSTYKNSFKVLVPGKFLMGHVPYSKIAEEVHQSTIDLSLTIVRDPRDMIFSMLRHVRERPQHHAFNYLYKTLKTDIQRFFAIAEGYENPQGRMVGLEQMISSMLDWQVCSNNLCVRFEEIIGPSGGGTFISQQKVIEEILKFIDEDAPQNNLQNLADNTFGKSSTFRKGQSYGWKNVLSENDNKYFEEKYSSTLLRMGYEDQ